MENKMIVEIWSDVVCPYCYIGKRKLEKALSQFEDSRQVNVVWKSYILDPTMPDDYDKSTYEQIASKYGTTVEEAKATHRKLEEAAKAVGLDYDFDKVKPANTMKAHQLIHFAKANGKQDEAEETLFRTYFTEGKNINNVDTLAEICSSLGLNKEEFLSALAKETYHDDARADIYEAKQVGVQGVPFFVFNRKYAVRGGQEPAVFLEVLQKSFSEWRKDNPLPNLEIIEGQVCTPDGKCD